MNHTHTTQFNVAADAGQRDQPPVIAGLYVHVPFCFHKCHYCDFYSLAETGDDRHDRFVDALIGELEHLAARYRPRPRTLFVGGGTPTLLSSRLWGRLLTRINELGLLSEVREFTVEANPETVTGELAQVLARGGVNRVSIGAQTFDAGLLKQLERWHDPRNVSQAVEIFRGAGVANVNLDLIFAIPTQTPAQLDADLDAALALGPEHLSCYSLIFEPNTPLTQKLKLGRLSAVGEEAERAMYERVIDRLAAAGYEQYEISNWARLSEPRRAAADGSPPSPLGRGAGGEGTPSEVGGQSTPTTSIRPHPIPLPEGEGVNRSPYRCQHNLTYWRSENWLAAGPSASGHLDGYRWKNAPRLGDYIAQSPRPPRVDEERLPPRARLGEHLMMRLRLREGAPLDMVPDDVETEPLIERGLLERTDTHLRLTREGLFLADSVIARLL